MPMQCYGPVVLKGFHPRAHYTTAKRTAEPLRVNPYVLWSNDVDPKVINMTVKVKMFNCTETIIGIAGPIR